MGLLAFLAAVADTSSGQTPAASGANSKGAAAAVNDTAANPPAGSQRCMFCHPAEVAGYSRTTMAHSLRRADQEPDGTLQANGSKIVMHSSPDGYVQRWENAGEARDYRVEYVIGSGAHASGYLVNLGGHLFQSPVAFYTTRRAYDLAPGYENTPDPDFTRPVSEECVLCHSGTALPVAGTLNEYRAPVFSADAITCERCHGPVEKHLADPRAGNIVNPARLEGAARDSICEQCHLFGVARVANPGKTLADFVPGQRLEDTFTIYRNAVPAGSPAGSFKVISHVEQLALSACARNSGGRLWCGTCHDPHNKPVQAVPYYRARCLSCHTAPFPASHPAKDTDCLSCHMPRRNARDGGHTVFTDHRIQRQPAPETDLPADTGISAWREPAPEQQRRNLGIAYIDVGMQRHSSSFIIQGYRALTAVQQQFSQDSELFKWIGDALLVGRQTADAKFAFERALQLDPSPLTEAGAASPYIQDGELGPAIQHLERAVSLDPLYLPAASTLLELYQKQGKTAEAAALASRIDAALHESPASDRPGAAAPPDSAKRAQEVFKNLQVLKEIPADQLVPAMEFISSSLGVACTYCHLEGQFDKDDKKAKQTARKMMQMTRALNKDHFADRREITCYSCHRGATAPVSTPVAESEWADTVSRKSDEGHDLSAGLPTVSQLLENYVAALGGASAIDRIRTLRERGTATFQGHSVSVEIFAVSPDKRAVLRHFPEGDSSFVFDGLIGRFALAGRPPRELHGADLEAARMDADLQFALHIRRFYPDLRVEYPESVASRPAYALYAMRDSRPAAKFFFDEQSGLLVRVLRFAPSPFGDNPTQTDYADYRDVDGAKLPFRITLSQPQSVETIQLDEIQKNVAIDGAKFAALPRSPRP